MNALWAILTMKLTIYSLLFFISTLTYLDVVVWFNLKVTLLKTNRQYYLILFL
jgi:hypothetical protein